MRIDSTIASTIDELKTFFTNNSTIVNYVLATPTYEEVHVVKEGMGWYIKERCRSCYLVSPCTNRELHHCFLSAQEFTAPQGWCFSFIVTRNAKITLMLRREYFCFFRL
jgi:hypothetical protein